MKAVLPLVLPGVFTVVVFTSSSRMTISVVVPTNLVRGDVLYWQSLMASALVVAIPVALVYNLFLRRFIQGFTLGAVKG